MEQTEVSGEGEGRRPSWGSQESAPSNLDCKERTNSVFSYQSSCDTSCTSWSSSMSKNTTAVRLQARAASTDYGVIRRRPSNPLLVLFTRDPESSERSIVSIKIDGETKPNPKRCNCHRSLHCAITTIERRDGTPPTLFAKRLEDSLRWDLLRLPTAPSNWDGLLRVSILFPTVEARHRFGGSHCTCRTVTEGDVDVCLSKGHQGILGMVRVYYRRQMVLWQQQRENQREVDDRPGQMGLRFSPGDRPGSR